MIYFKSIEAVLRSGFIWSSGRGVLSSIFAQQIAPADRPKRRWFVPFRCATLWHKPPPLWPAAEHGVGHTKKQIYPAGFLRSQ